MTISASEIIDFLENSNLKYIYIGNKNINIIKYSSINSIKTNNISWVKNKTYFNENIIRKLRNVILVVTSDIYIDENYIDDKGFIICENPKEIFFSILNEFYSQNMYQGYISTKSIIETINIGINVYIGHNCYIGKDVIIGNNVTIKNNVSIEGKAIIGNSTIIHSGVRIGTDGFGYYQNKDGKNIRVPHYGGVVIGEDVEIGSNTCIDGGTLEDTYIGNNVKINNLCHIAHNVAIFDNCIVAAGVIVTGSVIVGNNSYIAPGAIIRNQLMIGSNTMVGMGSVVIKDVEDNKVVAGVPAKVIREN